MTLPYERGSRILNYGSGSMGCLCDIRVPTSDLWFRPSLSYDLFSLNDLDKQANSLRDGNSYKIPSQYLGRAALSTPTRKYDQSHCTIILFGRQIGYDWLRGSDEAYLIGSVCDKQAFTIRLSGLFEGCFITANDGLFRWVAEWRLLEVVSEVGNWRKSRISESTIFISRSYLAYNTENIKIFDFICSLAWIYLGRNTFVSPICSQRMFASVIRKLKLSIIIYRNDDL